MAILNVPGTYSTISAAIAASSPGDTIVVAAGVYTEHVIINVANLTLKGAQAGVDARTRPFVLANESIITFPTPTLGTGIVNITMPNIILDGFTVQGNVVNLTGAIFAGDAGQFPPRTTTINVTGLQILNNIIQNNANGILIASIESTPLPVNYLVKHNFFFNNSGDPVLKNGKGVSFNNNAIIPMSNVLVTENLFNGLETGASVDFFNISDSTISNNVMNNDNSIKIVNASRVTISGNVTSGATGITVSYPTNTADAIFINNSVSTIITKNIISAATNRGINIFSSNSIITITNNCIVNNTNAGITTSGIDDSLITINGNNISGNHPGLQVDLNSYTQTINSLDATNNFWGNASGPNYNSTGPGTGDAIIDLNIPDAQTVVYSPFLTVGTACPSPITVTKSTISVNVVPGGFIAFNVMITVPANTVMFQISSFVDQLPTLAGGGLWSITMSTPVNFFSIIGNTPQFLTLTVIPATLPPGVYSVTVQAPVTIADGGQTYTNTVSGTLQMGGMTQSFSSTAVASVAVCVHGSSLISLPGNKEIAISELKSGSIIMTADGKEVEVVEVVPCIVSYNDKFFGPCVIFEKDSLGENVPSKRFVIDAGHPICTQESYKKGEKLRMAKYYVNDGNIYMTTWDEAGKLMPGENKRYDIIMPEDSCKAYIANGIVVQARQSRLNSGYSWS
jgi:hypothetical protein